MHCLFHGKHSCLRCFHMHLFSLIIYGNKTGGIDKTVRKHVNSFSFFTAESQEYMYPMKE